MRKILLTTVAVAAVVGYAGIAAAQNTDNQPKGSPGGQQEQKAAPSGAMAHPQGGTQPASKTMSPSGQSAQSPAQGAKQDERVGQGQDQNETKTPQRGPEQKGAQEDRTTPQKGAQEQQPATQQKGAQEQQPATQQKGAQDENSKSGVNATEQHATKSQGARGASVQLSQDQRSRIGAVIGKSSSARVSTNIHFNVAVGVRVPRDVHVEILPEDIVQIVPEYEGYDYVLVGDNILIIDPDTLEIVAVIPV
jgi:Protein of unknown function (DUF1236)